MSLIYSDESYSIRGAAFDVYKALGCGHKETVYMNAFSIALLSRGLKPLKEIRIPVYFQGKKVGTYVPDICIGNKIFIELKAKAILTHQDIHQFWDYLTSSNFELGFLINFGKPGGVEIIRRVYGIAPA